MILIISDYHGKEDKVLELIQKYNPEKILCMGDGCSNIDFYEKNNIISVLGNCDTANLDLDKVLEINGHRVLMCHGHLYQVYYDMSKLYYLAKEKECDYVFFGHTHIQHKEEYGGVTFINPGAVADDNYCLWLDNGDIIFKCNI